ncbi:MAG: L-threonylcarbamoyladenylate synthase [Patescibacteria group bacterium]|jgi:L-threonylcarbamoyladenylate synthase
MIHLKINSRSKISKEVIDLVAASLNAGKIIISPTDTIYGLSCLANNVSAIKKIHHLKNRSSKKPLIVLVDSLKMLKKYVFVSAKQERILKKIWFENNRPATVILKHRRCLPEELTGDSNGLAVRLPKNDFLLKMIGAVALPLVSTSLNLSGQENIHDLNSLLHYFPEGGKRFDLIIDAGKCRRRKPSKLIDLRDENNPEILRK